MELLWPVGGGFSSALFLFLVTERVNSTGPGWPGGDLFLSLPKIVGPGNPDGSFACRRQRPRIVQMGVSGDSFACYSIGGWCLNYALTEAVNPNERIGF